MTNDNQNERAEAIREKSDLLLDIEWQAMTWKHQIVDAQRQLGGILTAATAKMGPHLTGCASNSEAIKLLAKRVEIGRYYRTKLEALSVDLERGTLYPSDAAAALPALRYRKLEDLPPNAERDAIVEQRTATIVARLPEIIAEGAGATGNRPERSERTCSCTPATRVANAVVMDFVKSLTPEQSLRMNAVFGSESATLRKLGAIAAAIAEGREPTTAFLLPDREGWAPVSADYPMFEGLSPESSAMVSLPSPMVPTAPHHLEVEVIGGELSDVRIDGVRIGLVQVLTLPSGARGRQIVELDDSCVWYPGLITEARFTNMSKRTVGVRLTLHGYTPTSDEARTVMRRKALQLSAR